MVLIEVFLEIMTLKKSHVNIYEIFDSVDENSQSSQIAANEPEKFESY